MLKKELNLLDVFCIASGAMISSGLFILPAVVYKITGPSMILSYIFAAFLMIPALASKAELATAMPKSGGSYFFIHRSMGAFMGTFAGLASWFSLSLKSSFALLGVGLFLAPVLPEGMSLDSKLIAVGVTVVFTLLNIFSVKSSGKIQIIMVFLLLAILVINIFGLAGHIEITRFVPFTPNGWTSVFAGTGMVFISFGGLTKIASVAEEIKRPGWNIPLGMFLAFFVVSILYFLIVSGTIGVLDPEVLTNTVNPISEGASVHFGRAGFLVLSFAAMLSFLTTGNAGLMSSSRIPLAMADDNLIPDFFSRISLKFNTPVISILLTSFFMICTILFLELETLVKVASTMMLILFLLVNVSVIMMRASKMVTYKPSFKDPFYPVLQVVGIIVYIFLIFEMGVIPLSITVIFLVVSLIWYLIYSRTRNKKESALIRLTKRVSSKDVANDDSDLEFELKNILMKRDEIIEDKFDKLIENATFLDLTEDYKLEQLLEYLSSTIADKNNLNKSSVLEKLKEREEKYTSALGHGLAIPHIIVEGEHIFDILVARSQKGVYFDKGDKKVHVIFALIGTLDERKFHLQALMSIAQIIQNKDFLNNWQKARNINELRNLILVTERVRRKQV